MQIGQGAGAGMILSGYELGHMSVNGLSIGLSRCGGITVNGITAANSQSVDGMLTLYAGAAGSKVAWALLFFQLTLTKCCMASHNFMSRHGVS